MTDPPAPNEDQPAPDAASGADQQGARSAPPDPSLPASEETLVRAPAGEPLDETLVVPPAEADETLVRPPADERPQGDQVTMRIADPDEVARQAALLREAPSAEETVKPFGDYDLLSLIAKGGMGVVYRARQRKLNRIVAIKMILSGQLADSTEVGRFYAEAEAAANLRHPNIVGIYEIGEVDGQHFFSMEYIEGKSLSDLSSNPLAPDRAAEYVRKIAAAMQFAHDRGILHRDLKPSNVLVDGRDEPLITDFGLAKRVEEHSQLTITGAIVGTPSYMPPEQARGEVDNIDATSDVYSTGAVLYELLTGAPPFRSASPFETIRQVLTVEPAPPRVVNPSIPRDLETICLKAMQKEKAARYASQQELADELGRFLAGEPIQARPIGPVARLWRWCRRNPAVASLAAAAVLFMILALAGTSIGYVQAKIAQRESDQSFRDSRATVDDLFTQVSDNDLLNQPGMQPLRQELLQRALVYYQKFLRQRGDDPTVRKEMAGTFYRIGYITGEIESPEQSLPWYRKALEIQIPAASATPTAEAYSAVGDTWNQVGVARHKIGEIVEAKAAYLEAIAARQRVAELAPAATEHHRKHANSVMNLGLLLREQDEIDTARKQMQHAQQIRGKLLAEGRTDLRLRRDFAQGCYNVAVLEWRAEQPQSADENFAAAERELSRLLQEDPHDLWNQWRLATCLRLRADLNASQLDDRADSAAEGQSSPLERVASAYDRARELLGKLALRNPDVVEYQAALAQVLMNLGTLQQRFQRDRAALDTLRQAVAALDDIVARDPAERHRRDLAVTKCEFGVQLAIDEQLAEAATQLRQSHELLVRLRDERGEQGAYSAELARTEEVRAWIRGLQDPPSP